MGSEWIDLWKLIGVPLLAAVVGAWLSAYFALRRFFREKILERKMAAYTALFGALHDIEVWHDRYLRAGEQHMPIGPEEAHQLDISYEKAFNALRSKISAEIWVIPKSCSEPLQVMISEFLLRTHGGQWLNMMEDKWAMVHNAIETLRCAVREDLKLERKHLLTQIAGLLPLPTIGRLGRPSGKVSSRSIGADDESSVKR